MLLKDVESVVSTKLNTIIREAEKEYLCTLRYEPVIGSVYFDDDLYLTTNTELIIKGQPYTTFKGHRLYKNEEEFESNPCFNVECNKETIKIGYVNKDEYLHLPDFLTTQLLYVYRGGVKAVVDNIVLVFTPNGAKVFKLNTKVPNPYYVYVTPFDYNENADLLAKIIGLTDVYKRKLLNKEDKVKYFYFLFPYVSLVLYKRLRTTLYPPYVSTIVNDVYNLLEKRVKDEVGSYFSMNYEGLAGAIQELIEKFNDSSKIIVSQPF